VQGPHLQLARNTAGAFLAMQRDCLAATKARISIYEDGAYRDWETQARMKANQAHYGVPIADAGLSTHGRGTAVDVFLSGTLLQRTLGAAWLAANRSRYGFAKPPANDKAHNPHNGTVYAAAPALPSAPPEQDAHMTRAHIYAKDSYVYFYGPEGVSCLHSILNAGEANQALGALGLNVSTVEVLPATADGLGIHLRRLATIGCMPVKGVTGGLPAGFTDTWPINPQNPWRPWQHVPSSAAPAAFDFSGTATPTK